MRENILNLLKIIKVLNKRYIFFILFAGFISSLHLLLGYFSPLLYQKAIDTVVYQKLIPYQTIFYIMIIFGLSVGFQLIGNILFPKYLVKIDIDICNYVMQKAVNLNYKYIKEKGTGYFTRIFTEDAHAVLRIFYNDLIQNTFSLLRLIPILITIFFWDIPILYFLFPQ